MKEREKEKQVENTQIHKQNQDVQKKNKKNNAIKDI